MTPRAAGVLLANLPPGAALWRAKGVNGAWTEEAHHLADISDILAGANWQRGGGKGARPKPVLRPPDIKAAAERQDRNFRRAEAYLRRRGRVPRPAAPDQPPPDDTPTS